MEDENRIKSISTDPRSKKRLRFTATKERAKNASADVYRSYKRRIGVTSAASREERVHHPQQEETKQQHKRPRKNDGTHDRVAVLRPNNNAVDDESFSDSELDVESTFASELDLAQDRNASEIFSQFYRDVWHLVQSLPEVLHHAPEIIDILMAYLLSPESTPEEKSPTVNYSVDVDRITFIANQATTDVLHLLAVLARDLRHEIHPHVHSKIMPRIIYDLLNPPLQADKQPLPLSVTLVETAFRTLAYVFRYNAEPLLSNVDKEGHEPCLDKMRQYYGATLGHKRDYVRRLAAESFAPMIRKLKTDGGRRKHIRRVLRALAVSGQEPADATDGMLSHSMKRAQSDAIDGVALLLFETARGMPGRLHSKGNQVIRCVLDCLTSGSTGDGTEVLFSVTSAFMEKICTHLKRENFSIVWKEMFQAAAMTMVSIGESNADETHDSKLRFVLELINQIITFNGGIYIHKPNKNRVVEGYDECVKSLVELLKQLLEPNTFCRLSSETQLLALQVLASSWRALPDNPKFAAHISPLLPAVLSLETKGGNVDCGEGDSVEAVNPAIILARDLLPYLPPESGVKLVGRAILAAAAKQASQSPTEALMLVFSVASIRRPDDTGGMDDDDDNVFFTENAPFCGISSADKRALINLCLVNASECCLDSDGIATLGIAVRCLPFLLVAGKADEDSNAECRSLFKRMCKWALAVLEKLDNPNEMNSSEDDESLSVVDIAVAKSLLLESCARMASICIDEEVDSVVVKNNLSKMRSHVEKILFECPSSMWIVKGAAAFVDALGRCDLPLSDSANQIFEALVPNLRDKNHFLRLHSLEILASFPKRPFVTDHAEIDWTDDLDEEPSSAPSASASRSDTNHATPTGLCDVIDTLLKLESTPISFQNERQIVGSISRIEVLGRSGRMPVVYAEAVSNHLLGILYVKFSPLWPAAVRALISLAGINELSVWEPLSIRLKEVTAVVDANDVAEEQGHCGSVSTPNDHHQRCVAWESTHGKDPGLFRNDVTLAREDGRVSRHLSTDEPTVFGLVWSVLEGAPELTAKKSRTIVPIFLEFLHQQYFSYHDNDPDARELCLESEIEDASRFPLDWSYLGRSVLNKRLSAFLKVFATVNGPQQLYKHHLLLSIFTCFVSNQETAIAQCALSCVLKFKQPFVIPYADHLRGMLKKGALRDTMLNFDISKESEMIDPEHRASLIPLITRIMFGRLSARAAISKSSKETPAARRAAVLSFLSVLDGQDGELYPLFYQMVRSYIPKQHILQPMETQVEGEKESVTRWLESVKAKDLSHLRDQRHEGFLNLLSAAISQLGHDVQGYVPAFVSIILALCKHAEVGASPRIEGKEDEHQDSGADEERHRPEPERKGVLRTLCFRRLAELHDTYASSIDFLPYGRSMWETLIVSVRELPVTVAYADRAPALLTLLKTLSSRSLLIPILSLHEEVVPSAIKCISDTSKQSVANAALDIVENLLTNGGGADGEDSSSLRTSCGMSLIEKSMPLLLRQLAVRLGSNGFRKETLQSTPQRRCVDTQCTRRRELSILCRISSLVLDGLGGDCEQEVLQTLCDLLIPFLSPDRKSNDQDQMSILEILSALIPHIESEAAVHYFPSLSRLFGPYKAKRKIGSLPVRRSLASLISLIADSGSGKSLQPVAGVVERLCAIHSKRVDEIDFDEVLPALNDLGSGRGWRDLCKTRQQEVDPTVLSPLISLCFHFLYDEDGVVSRAASKAVKTLISFAAQEANHESDTAQNAPDAWVRLVETTIVPTCRSGLSSKDKAVRRLFILLFAELAQSFKDFSSPNLYGDLAQLIRDDDPDLDFFLNVTHVQIHRRSRAFQRLRKILLTDVDCPFSTQSLSNFLLPIAMHPIYESKTKADEALALDAVETVGALAMHLSWSKYHNILWTLLNQFERNPEQERYMVGAICSVIDAFHFELIDEKVEKDDAAVDDMSSSPCDNNAVWRALEKRIIPKAESLLIKEKTDRTGTKVKNLRPSVVLALSKLFRKFPVSFFETRLTRLIVVICGALKSRDSDARDIARKTLASMTADVGVKYLSDIIRQLAVSLSEGYQLHVRMATLHTILQTLAKSYQPSLAETSKEEPLIHFDTCIPAMMDLIQQDLFGTARERREAEGAMKRLVKEASGSKSTDAIELICRMLTFMPSSVARAPEPSRDALNVSAIHAVVSPLLERLRSPDVTTRVIGRIGECLTRVVVGISHNRTVTSEEILPFVYATISPFVGQCESTTTQTGGVSDDDSSDDEASGNRILISRTGAIVGADGIKSVVASKMSDAKVARANVVEWRPSALNAVGNAVDARDTKAQERRELRRTQDGASAPKLTGSGRHTTTSQPPGQSINDPASISGVTFGLSLLHSFLKKGSFDASDGDCRRMLDIFIPMLTTCVCTCRNNEVILLSLRCLAVLLRLKLPSVEEHSFALGAKTLDILTSSGSLTNLNQELTQTCFKTLTLLIPLDASQSSNPSLESGTCMPLDIEQMQVLISLLKAAVVESDHHHPTLGLIKAIVKRQFMSPEFYDLMETMLDLSVKSHKATLRQMSSKIFMQYLVGYPMGEARLEDHLRQVVLNAKYEYEEGRLSAIALVAAIVEKLPVELLEKHSQLFFLPLVLQFVNDDSKDCREALSDCLSRLLSRAPMQVVQSFYDYTVRWSLGTGPLKRTSLQLFGIFIDARPDFLKKGDTTNSLVHRLYELIDDPVDSEWEVQYFALLALEKLSVSPFSSLLEQRPDLWATVVAKLIDPHPWIKRVSSRMVGAQLCSLDATSFASNTSHFLVERPGLLYQVARNVCAHLDLDETEWNEELSATAIKTLVWTVQAMKQYPELCYAEDNDEERNPAKWLMARLSNIAKPKGSKRREGIFKCFAAFITVGGIDLVMPYLELILEPLHRSITESDQMMESIRNSSSRNKQLVEESEEVTLAKDVLHMLEECCGDDSEAFLRAFGAVKTKAREKREDRKKWIATEAMVDPQASAVRKMKKHEQEKRRRKRKVDKHRQDRGGRAKRRHVS